MNMRMNNVSTKNGNMSKQDIELCKIICYNVEDVSKTIAEERSYIMKKEKALTKKQKKAVKKS